MARFCDFILFLISAILLLTCLQFRQEIDLNKRKNKMQKEEEDLKNFILNVTKQLDQLFPDVGFTLTIFDHFSSVVLASTTNSQSNLTEVYEQMLEYEKQTTKTFVSKIIGTA